MMRKFPEQIKKKKKNRFIQDTSYSDFSDKKADSVDLDETALNEPLDLDLRCFHYPVMCVSIGTSKINKFSVCPKWKINYF